MKKYDYSFLKKSIPGSIVGIVDIIAKINWTIITGILWCKARPGYTKFIINSLCHCWLEISLKKAKKSERVEAILLSAIVPISKAEIMEKLPDISIKTVELVLSKMVKEKKIYKIGSYKDASFMRKSNIKE